jgi:hypothetical protein
MNTFLFKIIYLSNGNWIAYNLKVKHKKGQEAARRYIASVLRISTTNVVDFTPGLSTPG